MSFLHKYQEYDFQNDFRTCNSILRGPYDPEVIFIGTYNHGWSWNESDFFYGRDMYMWTIMANLFIHNNNILIDKRNKSNNIPSRPEILEICKKGKIIFADIVKGINVNIMAIEQPNSQEVLVDRNYTWRTYKDGPLDKMADRGWIDDNVDAIINYINRTPTIKEVYFTFKSGGWLVEKKNEIINRIRKDVPCCSIFTPTANGFGKNLLPPFEERAWSLTHCWVWNGLDHKTMINKPDFGHLSHDWLRHCGVNINNF